MALSRVPSVTELLRNASRPEEISVPGIAVPLSQPDAATSPDVTLPDIPYSETEYSAPPEFAFGSETLSEFDLTALEDGSAWVPLNSSDGRIGVETAPDPVVDDVEIFDFGGIREDLSVPVSSPVTPVLTIDSPVFVE